MKRILTHAFGRAGALAVLALSALLASGAASAAGTFAGTNINNVATMNYSVGNVTQTAIGSSPGGNSSGTGTFTVFTVDNKVVHTVVTNDGAPVSAIPGQTTLTTTFVVSNTGNNTQDYILTTGNATGSIPAFTTNTTGTLTAACSIVGGTRLSNVAPDATPTVKVVCTMNSNAVNNDVFGVYLQAQAAGAGGGAAVSQTAGANTAGVDIVLADTAGSEGGDIARDGKHSDRSAYQINTAALKVTKAVVPLCDPFNGSTNPKNIPGAYVAYTITIANAASANASAKLAQVTDTLAASLALDPDLIAGATAGTCAAYVNGGPPATTGVPQSGPGNTFLVDATGTTRAGFPKYVTSSSGDADGASVTGQTITLDFATLLPVVAGSYAAGELKPGESTSVTFNVKIN